MTMRLLSMSQTLSETTSAAPDRHVFDHAPAQRAHRLVGHGDAPVLSEVANSSSSRQDAPSRYRVAVPVARSALPHERFSPLRVEQTCHGRRGTAESDR